ncbi:MAG: ADP-ribosylglycohydrolase family protein, partial [Oscillospiraceae bacterium]|nr:ADP-ribosylglycohydrolase family protein [Oscillospiraceae bacterium]
NNDNPLKSWLLNVKELNHKRAPGNTCISALTSEKIGTIEEPINDSKGCGSVMRVAPVGIYLDSNTSFDIGAKTGAITHGHPLGYLSSGLLALIITKIINTDKENLEEIIKESLDDMNLKNEYNKKYVNELNDIITKAIELSNNSTDTVIAIAELGEGWVAEEALAIAVYCALKNKSDFSQAIIDAVNHNGDSDSTGAITGNIIGAYLGYNNIPKNLVEDLELKDVILEIAKDLVSMVPVSEYGDNNTEEAKIWFEKYLNGTYKSK